MTSPRGMLAGFRGELYRCLGKRRDALFELADAALCKQDRVHMLAELSLAPECRRRIASALGRLLKTVHVCIRTVTSHGDAD